MKEAPPGLPMGMHRAEPPLSIEEGQRKIPNVFFGVGPGDASSSRGLRARPCHVGRAGECHHGDPRDTRGWGPRWARSGVPKCRLGTRWGRGAQRDALAHLAPSKQGLSSHPQPHPELVGHRGCLILPHPLLMQKGERKAISALLTPLHCIPGVCRTHRMPHQPSSGIFQWDGSTQRKA